MIRATSTVLLFLLLGGNVSADGFIPMALETVLPMTDTIILVEITENKRTTILHKAKGDGNFEESVTYTNDIKSKVLNSLVGDFAGKIYNTTYSLVLVQGVWQGIPGSGLEGDMQPGEKYVLLLKKNGSEYSLLRAEKVEILEKVLQLKKDQVEEERRVAREERE